MRIILLLTTLLLLSPVWAQSNSPDYAIQNIHDPELSAEGKVLVGLDVVNIGATASVNATVRMVNKTSGEQVATEIVRPLLAGEGLTVTLTFPMTVLPAGQPQTMLVSVGIDEVEASTGNIANNMVNVLIPAVINLKPAVEESLPEASGVELDILGFKFNSSDPGHLAMLTGMSGALVIMALLLIVILRLLFRRQPTFHIQPPPYANVPQMSATTDAGRRQSWQLHAQNDLPPPYPSNEGATHVRKLLIGVGGETFSNWQITGLRLSQYDQYGRVTRSEIIAKRSLARKLSKIAARSTSSTEEQVSRRVKPVARSLARQFRRQINKRSAMLPVALDISFDGVHGEVKILFELYHMEQGRWRQVDSWEPEMTITGKALHENFTYSLHGLQTGENFRAFPGRFQTDLTTLLTDMLRHNQPGEAQPQTGTGSWSPFDRPEPLA